MSLFNNFKKMFRRSSEDKPEHDHSPGSEGSDESVDDMRARHRMMMKMMEEEEAARGGGGRRKPPPDRDSRDRHWDMERQSRREREREREMQGERERKLERERERKRESEREKQRQKETEQRRIKEEKEKAEQPGSSQRVAVSDKQERNRLGGFSFVVDDLMRFRRLIVLGVNTGAYNASATATVQLGVEHNELLQKLIGDQRGMQVLEIITTFSTEGRTPKQDTLLYSLAVLARQDKDLELKKEAYKRLAAICRIPTFLFMFLGYSTKLSKGKGWGRASRTGVAKWYLSFRNNPLKLAQHITKYQSREGWCHRDLLRLSHVSLEEEAPALEFIFTYIVKGMAAAKAKYPEVWQEGYVPNKVVKEVVETEEKKIEVTEQQEAKEEQNKDEDHKEEQNKEDHKEEENKDEDHNADKAEVVEDKDMKEEDKKEEVEEDMKVDTVENQDDGKENEEKKDENVVEGGEDKTKDDKKEDDKSDEKEGVKVEKEPKPEAKKAKKEKKEPKPEAKKAKKEKKEKKERPVRKPKKPFAERTPEQIEKDTKDVKKVYGFLTVVESMKNETSEEKVIAAVRDHGLVREHLPTQLLKSVPVWAALCERMPLGALIRNLGRMTSLGLLTSTSDYQKVIEGVCEKLVDDTQLKGARIHPFNVLMAMMQYKQGHGDKSSLKWAPNQKIIDTLDETFYKSFKHVEATNKRWLLALDVSGSMCCPVMGSNLINCRDASAAMAMVTARTEPNHEIVGFSHRLTPLNINKDMRMDEVINVMSGTMMGGTDCAAPMIWAQEHKKEFDVFVVYTDSETWYGRVHPHQALKNYRNQMNIPDARLIVVGMSANRFTIADPDDPGMMDIAGFDSAAPEIMRSFSIGDL